MSTAPALVVLTQAGCHLARRIADALPEAEIVGLDRRVDGADRGIDDVTGELQALFRAGRPIVGVCATGILIRALAPLLSDKRQEPPVLAVSEDGAAVVPLLGGHRGANGLARRIADALGVTPAITTAGDRRFGVALDAPPPGWHLANPHHHKDFAAALLSGAGVRLDGDAPWLAESGLPFAEDADLVIRVTETADAGDATRLVYHPAVLALGVGCERGASADEVIGLVRDTLDTQGLAAGAVAGLFTIDLKHDEPAVLSLADHLGVPLRVFDAARLEQERPRLANPSDLVFREVGCHGVAEGAALAAAGPDATLIVPKTKSKRATCAVALAPQPIDATAIGAAVARPGSLAVVGLGPGDPQWRTAEAEQALQEASDLVGYQGYLDLLGDLTARKTCHAYALGAEQDRVRAALDLAAAGRDVALVSSGDPGIYAMAALVFEELDRAGREDWRRLPITVCPGVSALQAAAARIGAPLGHDFCAISLSDLLTPADVITARLRAAAEGDFVVALYNPASGRRWRLLDEALAILRRHRPAGTPVVLARNLGRPGETVDVVALEDLSPARVDMLTLLLIGSSETRRVARDGQDCWVYTPRGYAAKTPGTSSEDAA